MSEYINWGDLDPISPQMEQRSYTFWEAWREALTEPSVETYQRLGNSLSANLTTALLWVFIAFMIASPFSAASNAFYNNLNTQNSFQNSEFEQQQFQSNPGVSFIVGAICSPVAAVIGLFFFFVRVGISHLVARALGGVGSFDSTTYAIAAFYAPLTLIGNVIGIVPYVGLCVSLPALLYILFLDILAIKSVHNLNWVYAWISSWAAAFLLIIPLCACVLVLLLAAAG